MPYYGTKKVKTEKKKKKKKKRKQTKKRMNITSSFVNRIRYVFKTTLVSQVELSYEPE